MPAIAAMRFPTTGPIKRKWKPGSSCFSSPSSWAALPVTSRSTLANSAKTSIHRCDDFISRLLHLTSPASASRVLEEEEGSEEHTSELQSRENLVCRLLLEKKKKQQKS